MAELQINTTQNVKIKFNAAGAGARVVAFLIDTAIKIGYLMLLNLAFGVFDNMDQWSQIAINTILGFPVMLYSLVQESILQGQTVGKRLLKIRVVKIDGYQASFSDYAVRWFFRVVDVYVFALGFFVMLFNNKTQRLGDIAAGTAVIALKDRVNISHTILEHLGNDYKPTYPNVIKLTDNDARIIKDTFITAKAANDYATIKKLKDKLVEVVGIKDVKQQTNSQFIEVIMKDYNYYTQDM